MKIGDKVRVVNGYPDYKRLSGATGVVVGNNPRLWPETPICVQFDDHRLPGLHTCDGLTPHHNGRWFHPRYLEVIGPPAFNLKLANDFENVDEVTALATKLAELTGLPVQVIHA